MESLPLRCGALLVFSQLGGHRASELGQGLLAPVQVAHWPFERNWAHLPEEPSHIYLEVGANSRNLERDDLGILLSDKANGFLLTFEPLLDKYAYLLTRQGGRADTFSPLGLQHQRGLALPYAVDNCKSDTAVFHVAPTDGCSSLRRPARDFPTANKRSSVHWDEWVEKSCAVLQERRSVPCVSLETVIGEWLKARRIARLKIDAQGSDLDVVRSAGSLVERVGYVHMEVLHHLAADLYEGQTGCEGLVQEMENLGFALADRRLQGHACDIDQAVLDLHFIRKSAYHWWMSFFDTYHDCHPWVSIPGLLAAGGGCGGPFCVAPRLNAEVNRSICDGRAVDTIAFKASILGMVFLWVDDACHGRINVSRPFTSAGVYAEAGNVVLTLDLGSEHAESLECNVQLRYLGSDHGPIPRMIIRDPRHQRSQAVFALMLRGLATAPYSQALPALREFLALLRRADATLLWPERCYAQASSPVWRELFAEYMPSEVGKTWIKTMDEVCVMQRRTAA